MQRLLAVLSVFAPIVGHAEPVRVVAGGECPAHVSMEMAGLVLDETSSTELRVQSGSGQATMLLRRAGEEIARREVTSGDCPTIAEAFALIVADALADPPKQEAPEMAARESDPQEEPAGQAHVRERPERSEELGVTAKPSPPQNRVDGIAVAVIGGIGKSSMSPEMPGLLQADVAWELAGYQVRTAVWGHSASSFGTALERRELGVRFEFGDPLHVGRLLFRPSAGVAAVASYVSSVAAGQHDLLRVHPALSATMSMGWELTQKISLRADVFGLWYPIVDRYKTDADVVGESPRTLLGFGLGLEYRIH